MGGRAGKAGRYLSLVYDSDAGKYLAPDITHFDWDGDVDRSSLPRDATAILDTGMMLHHPLIKRSLVHSVDFTDEGIGDLNGHGTAVALLFTLSAPWADMVNVKVLSAEGIGQEDKLIRGIEWCVENKDRHNIHSINLSAGIYDAACRANCKLCRAAHRAIFEELIIVAAAGNAGPTKVPCPQKIGLAIGPPFFVVEVADLESGVVAQYSGKGNVSGRDASAISWTPIKKGDLG